MTFIIYHNPRCSKSRQTLALLEEKGVTPSIVEYLKTAPGVNEINGLKDKLNVSAIDMMRPKEAEFKEMGLSKDMSDDKLVAAMATCPKLIERPIVVHGDKAVLGRPPENIEELF